ncbi:MAG TPA: hypothetical protein VHM00_05220 [Caldimonas sp.]|nr:hypothetical protein [Caldimonas sp.]HEX2540465.1 hypothetical protein [Caldimonas sp.]
MTTSAGRPGFLRDRTVLLLGLVVAGCFPTFDWREARPERSGAALLFPCRPDRHERVVPLAGAAVRMQLHSCKAGGLTFSLALADVAEPLRVAPTLLAWRQLTVENIVGKAALLGEPKVAGATPNPEARTVRIDGRLPDGRPVVVHAAFFVKGLRVYQASVVGQTEPPPRESLETFFTAIRLSDSP